MSTQSTPSNLITNLETIDEIQGLVACVVQCCRFVDNQINQHPHLRQSTVEMLRDDAQRLVNACNSALQGGES